jgi:hypothetical protein
MLDIMEKKGNKLLFESFLCVKAALFERLVVCDSWLKGLL